MNIKKNSEIKINIRGAAIRLLVFISLISMGKIYAGTTHTWVGAGGDNLLQDTNNWSPLTTTLPSAAAADTLQWNGLVAGNLVLSNSAGGTFDSNPGFSINVGAAQTGSVTIVESNGFTGRIRLNGTNTFTEASGAGAFTFGNGGTVGLPIALAGAGNGAVHNFTNNSANPVTFNTDVYWVMGGGGSHTLLMAGTGSFNFNVTFQPNNSAALGLNIAGPGQVNLIGNPTTASGITTPGTYGSVTLNGGTLSLGASGAVGIGNTIVLNGGNLDSSVPNLVNSGNNVQTWGGNFGFIGTQNLDLGYGPVTMSGSRIVTVNASTLTVDGAIAGNGYSLTKAGAGTLVLNGYNTYTGGTVVSNGVLRLGAGGVIPSGSAAAESVTIAGGTLDLNGVSPTISSLNGAGNLDSTLVGGNVTVTIGDYNANGVFTGSIQNTAGSLALTKTGLGSLTLGGASTYSGGTTVSAGTLLVTNTSGSGTGSGTVTVAGGASFGGSGSIGSSVNWQLGSGALFVLGSPLTLSGNLILGGNNAVTVNVPGSIPLAPGTYTLLTYNNSGSSGTFPANGVVYTGAGVSPGTVSTIATGGGTVTLTVISTINGLRSIWTNSASGNWSVGANWDSNPAVPHSPGDLATLGVGLTYTTVTLDANESVGGVVFTNANSFNIADAGNTLSFDNSGNGAVVSVANGSSNTISTAVSLNDNLAASIYPGTALSVLSAVSGSGKTITVSGGGTLTLSGNNSYGPSAGSAGTTLFGGAIQLGNNNALGAGDLSVLGSATVRAVAPLAVANNVVITNGTTASLDNNGNSVSLTGVISGGGAFGKNGAGTLTLNNANSYNGDTSIGAGTVKLGNLSAIPGGNGNGNVNMGTNTVLDLNGFSPILNGFNNSPGGAIIDSLSGGNVTLTVGESGAYATFDGYIKNSSGTLALVKDGAGTQTLAGTNTYSGGTTINAGILQLGNGNTNASAGLGAGPVVINANGTLQFNLSGTNVFTNAISGSGALNVASLTSTFNLYGNNSGFTGPVNVNAGALWITNAGALGVGPKTVTAVAGGVSQLTAIHLDGSHGNINIDSSISFFLTYLNGVLYNEAGTNTIAGNISLPYGGGACYIISKAGFLTLSGNVASDGNANGRNFQLGGPGNGLFSGVASDNAQTLGSLTKVDGGTWTVSGASTTVGTLNANAGKLVLTGQWAGGPAVIASGGTLAGSGLVSNLTVNAGGNFVPGDYGVVGSFTVSNILTLSGATYVSLNKSLAQSNTVVNILTSGTTNVTATSGSTLIVSNLGPALVAGDRFQLFNQGVTNGNLIAITAPAGVLFTNNLAVDGSISVLPPNVATNPTNIVASVVGNQLILSWPTDHTGWHVQAQTNTLAVGLSTNWVTIPGTDASNGYTNTINTTNGAVFYRLTYP